MPASSRRTRPRIGPQQPPVQHRRCGDSESGARRRLGRRAVVVHGAARERERCERQDGAGEPGPGAHCRSRRPDGHATGEGSDGLCSPACRERGDEARELLLRRRHRRHVHGLRRRRRRPARSRSRRPLDAPGLPQGFLTRSRRRRQLGARPEELLRPDRPAAARHDRRHERRSSRCSGAKTGLITTRGHGDALLMMRVVRPLGRAADREAAARLPPPQAGPDRPPRADQGGLRARRLGGRRLPRAQRGRGRARRSPSCRRGRRGDRDQLPLGVRQPRPRAAGQGAGRGAARPACFVSCAHELIAKPASTSARPRPRSTLHRPVDVALRPAARRRPRASAATRSRS